MYHADLLIMTSAALLLKSDGIGGSGTPHAFSIDPKKISESDINYFIQVKVICSQIVFPELTKFSPIEGVPASEFTRVYGDSFISGYTEGGELSALVSIKLRDPSRKQEVRELLATYLDSQVTSVSHADHTAQSNITSQIDGETIISVSWRGGGNLKDKMASSWSLESLRAVSTEFPHHASLSPLRTECAQSYV